MRLGMNLLRRVLYYQAAVWAASGIAIAIAPRWVLETLFGQVSSPDDAFVRISGAMAVGLALMMVLVAQKVEELWWWSWAFALTDAGVVTIAALHAVFGLPEGSGSLMWWLFAGVNAAFAAALLAGMAFAAQEKPFA
jgi:hypothetical protein